MGLIVDIYRADYRSDLCIFKDVKRITVVNVDGPFDPTPDAPAAWLTERTGYYPNPIIIPVGEDGLPVLLSEVASGGSYAASSDSRFSRAVKFYGAVPIHDYAIGLEGTSNGIID